MTAVALHSFSQRKNYFAEITAWTLFATYTIAACDKNGLDFQKNGAEAVLSARRAIYGLLGQLCDEVSARGTLSEGDPLSEFAFYRPRALLIYALMGIYWMWSCAEGWNEPKHKAVVEGLIPEIFPPGSLWGEGAILHFLIYTWYRKQIDASPARDEFVATVLCEILRNKLDQQDILHRLTME